MAAFQAPDGLGNIVTATATVSNGNTTSPAVDCQRGQLVGIIMPAALDGDGFSLLGSSDGVNFVPIITDSFGSDGGGSPLAYSFNASAHQVILAFAGFAAPRWLQITTLSSGTPQAQSTNRTFTLVLRPQS